MASATATPKGSGSTAPKPAPAEAAVRNGVIAALGQPPGLFRVAAVPLWGPYYRVNVFVGPDATSVRIAHTYFVEATGGGDIVSATPPIARLYP